MNYDEYFEMIDKKVEETYSIAREARKKGFDPVCEVESPIAVSLAEKVVGLISTIYPQVNDSKIIQRITELEKEYGALDSMVSFKIAEEIAREKFCKFESHLQAMDAGIRVGFSYITIGVVSSPLEGFTDLKIGKTQKGEDYLIAYFSGPIRSAGTTASCMVLMLIDYLRECFGYAKYDPTEDEVKRYVTENYDYHERVNNLQYLPTEEEISFLAKNLPIQISGEPTESREVSNYKDLSRIESNFIRGGMCLIFSEGLAQKAQKGYGLWKGMIDKGLKATGWAFLEQYIILHKKREKGSGDTSATYIKDLVAGRPVFGHPSRKGGFRFRYGRNRMGGFSATSVHPATMGISDRFLSIGTQLKIEKPTKGCVISMAENIDGPIVKLNDGSVRRVETLELANKLYADVAEIIHFGDLLISFGDVANRKFDLIKPGYVEEWWGLQLEKKSEGKWKGDAFKIGFEEALSISKEHNIPLHPRWIYYWTELESKDLLSLSEWLCLGEFRNEKFVLPYFASDVDGWKSAKKALEIIGCEHDVSIEHVILKDFEARALLTNLGVDYNGDIKEQFDKIIESINNDAVLEQINRFSKIIIKDKAGTYIGARMGRPEKAKLRKLDGSPHALFPVGAQGGRLRSIYEAIEQGYVKAQFSLYFCDKCEKETIYPICETCRESCRKMKYHRKDGRVCSVGDYPEGEKLDEFNERVVDVGYHFEQARKMVGVQKGEIAVIKGVKGTSNKDHSCEHLGKGILRARYGLHVNKDGTIRYDMTEMALTHFKPKEIRASVEKLRELGYEKDTFGKELVSEDQILELFPHDIILPSCPDSADENADDVFLRVSHFIDDELEKLYGLSRFFNAKKREDIIGSLFVCIAPHICTATVGRLIGFSKTQTLLASPFMHAAMRRDCDGDEAAVFMLFDCLLNFSRKFLPAHRGGTQDAPLVLNTRIKAGDVDDQILDFEVGSYPLELYELAEQGRPSSEVKVENVKRRLKEGKNPFSPMGFTHSADNFNDAVINSSYKRLPSMQEKVDSMMGLCTKIRAVDTTDVARLIIERHFIRDIRGNLRKFSQQVFRCVDCNEKYRRPPLTGKCKCGGKLIFTISHGSVIKYLAPALSLARTYKVSPYLIECLEIVEKDIEGIFGKEKEKQEALAKWF